jgi:hypothetical protein
MLISNEDVQKDLKLSRDQVKKVAKETNYHRLARQELGDLTEEERLKKREALNRESEQFIAKLLTPEQAKRFHQITLQADGTQSFSKPDVVTALQLTKEQKQKIQALQEEAGKQIQALLKPGGDRQESMKKRGAILQSANEQILKLLTDGQKAKWKEMIGEPFKGEIRFGGGRTSGRPDRPR